jgi:hypothetical protein
MADQEEVFKSCEECGATIYPEHLEKQVAERWEGRLLCPFCLKEKRSAAGEPAGEDKDEPIAIVDLEDDAGIELTDGSTDPSMSSTAIRSFGGGPGGMSGFTGSAAELRRPMLKGSPNATRCKTFHCKLADGAIVYMNDQINEWADADDNIEIKFASSTIGVVEGKHADPHLIVTVFY